jgi:hypothetical protein
MNPRISLLLLLVISPISWAGDFVEIMHRHEFGVHGYRIECFPAKSGQRCVIAEIKNAGVVKSRIISSADARSMIEPFFQKSRPSTRVPASANSVTWQVSHGQKTISGSCLSGSRCEARRSLIQLEAELLRSLLR